MKIALAAAALAAVISSCAYAEDLSAISWTGPFAGLDLGYEWSHRKSTTHNSVTNAVTGQGDSTTDGPYGGFHVGYDYMIGPRFVTGAELEFNRSGRSRKTLVLGGTNSVTEVTSDSEWLGMLRGRLGYVVPDSPVMLVGSFGLYYSRTKSMQRQLSGTNGGLTAGMTDQAYSNTINLIGGAGVEIRVLPSWTVRTEMLFSQAGTSYQTYDKRHLRDQSNRINARYVQIGTSYRF